MPKLHQYIVCTTIHIKAAMGKKDLENFVTDVLQDFQGTEYKSRVTRISVFKTNQTTGFQVK